MHAHFVRSTDSRKSALRITSVSASSSFIFIYSIACYRVLLLNQYDTSEKAIYCVSETCFKFEIARLQALPLKAGMEYMRSI